jgi:predicted dienelactone hydrolase
MQIAYDQNFDPDSIFFGRIQTDAIGVAGYSLGGGRVMRG